MPTILTPEQFTERYGAESFSKFGTSDQGTLSRPETKSFSLKEVRRESIEDTRQTFSNVRKRFTEAADKTTEIKRKFQSGEQGLGSSALQTAGAGFGALSKSFGDVLVGVLKGTLNQRQEDAIKEMVTKTATKVLENPTISSSISGYVKTFNKLKPETQENLKGLFNIGMLYADAIGLKAVGPTLKVGEQVIKKGVQTGVKVTKQTVKRVFDTAKSVPERIANVRTMIGRTGKEVVGEAGVQAAKQTTKFTDNPLISGALSDINAMIGLPDSTPAVDLTFRAIKPRLTNKVNLRRVKEQMALANQTIVENQLKPTTVREYADAIFDTKKSVWDDIQAQLDTGQQAELQVDLAEIAVKILNKADDPALLRINPTAAKQLVKIAEDLVSQGDEVDILTAERIKQLLNAELDDAFGATDLSQQAKEAKKLITREIGDQLNAKLSTLPDEFRDLKIKYGSLSAIENDVLKRAIVFERANPEGLADILSKTQAFVDIATGGVSAKLKGVARLTIASQLKKANDVNELIRRAFEKLVQ